MLNYVVNAQTRSLRNSHDLMARILLKKFCVSVTLELNLNPYLQWLNPYLQYNVTENHKNVVLHKMFFTFT